MTLNVLNKFKKYIINTFDKSFIILVVGNLSYIAVLLLLRVFISSTDYGIVALVLTVFNMFFSFGYLGLDFTIVRLSYFNKGMNELEIPYFNKYFLFIPLFLISILFYYLLYELKIDLYILIPIIILSILSYFLNAFYNIQRLVKNFIKSQLISNLWKLIFFLSLLFLLVTERVNMINITWSLLISIIISLGLFNKVNTRFKHNPKTNYFLLQFFINTVLLLLVSHGEKFIIERSLGLEVLGDYYFVSSFVLYPFNFIQNYFGFKNTIDLKEDTKLSSFKTKIKNTFNTVILLVIIVFFLFSIIYFCNLTGYVGYFIFSLLVLIGIVKVFYSVFSAAAGALISEKTLLRMNILYAILILVLSIFLYHISLSLITIILFILILWLGRLIIWIYGVNTIRN